MSVPSYKAYLFSVRKNEIHFFAQNHLENHKLSLSLKNSVLVLFVIILRGLGAEFALGVYIKEGSCLARESLH